MYRGFRRFRAQLAPQAFLVGPNSAGKSTIVETIELAERCLRQAPRTKDTWPVVDGDTTVRAMPLPRDVFRQSDEDPVRYDFGEAPARASVTWSSGAAVHLL